MTPEKCASAFSVGTRWHVFGDGKIGVHSPYAGLVDREDSKVLRLYLPCIRLVSDSKGTAPGVVCGRGMELARRLTRAGPIGLRGRSSITAVFFHKNKNK
jgi:hypothetical protein